MSNNGPLTTLRKLKTSSGDILFDDEGIYNIAALLGLEGGELGRKVSSLLEHFGSPLHRDATVTKWHSWREALYALPEFDSHRINREIDYENYLSKGSTPVDSNPCPKCGYNNVMVGEQKRSLDEAGTTTARCQVCNTVYHPQ